MLLGKPGFGKGWRGERAAPDGGTIPLLGPHCGKVSLAGCWGGQDVRTHHGDGIPTFTGAMCPQNHKFPQNYACPRGEPLVMDTRCEQRGCPHSWSPGSSVPVAGGEGSLAQLYRQRGPVGWHALSRLRGFASFQGVPST